MLSSAVNRARAARSNDKGFTLIELLIVIVILGVLASIVVFSMRGITDKGDKAACKADIATVQTAEEAAFAQSGNYVSVATLVTMNLIRKAPDTVAVDTTSGAVTGADGATRKCAGIVP